MEHSMIANRRLGLRPDRGSAENDAVGSETQPTAMFLWILPWFIASVLVPSAINAGTIETASGRFEGKITFLPDTVKVGDKQIAFADILYLLADPASDRPPSPHLVRLKNGEVWAGQIVSGSSKKIDVRSDWYGQKAFDRDLISALEFVPRRPAPAGTKPRTLYRERHQPLPGDLMWMEADSLGMDSPLGAITIKRQGLVRYVMSNEPGTSPASDLDEVGLVDGNIYHGRLTAKDGQLSLEHDAGGQATFPADAVSFVVRHNPGLIEFPQLSSQVVPTGENALDKGKRSAIANPPLAGGSGSRFIRGVRIEPKMQIRYALPKRDGQKLLCRATLHPIAGALGDTRIRFLVGKKVVLDETLAPTTGRQPVDVQLPDGDELHIEIDFGPLLRFPCGVLLQDPHLVLAK